MGTAPLEEIKIHSPFAKKHNNCNIQLHKQTHTVRKIKRLGGSIQKWQSKRAWISTRGRQIHAAQNQQCRRGG